MQRSFTRWLKCCIGLSYKDRLAVCGLVTLERRRLLSDLILFYKIVNKLIDTDLINSLSLAPSTTRGHPFKVVYNEARINSRLHFFLFALPKFGTPFLAISLVPNLLTALEKALAQLLLINF